MASAGSSHAALMDEVYRGQRHIYDLTRKYYLFGRDTLIARLDARPGMRVLEVACGTGRNLAKVGKAWPGVRLFGLDISAEMLKSACAALGTEARLGEGDACAFDPQELLGEPAFERIVLSYSLSMIPDWEGALDHAAGQLADAGELHVVDFGDLQGLPGPFQTLLRRWLARFHVEPRTTLPAVAARIAHARGLRLESRRGPLGYYQLHVLSA
ncbi:methyltransferase domain-containing protein [Porphyrobacter sp. SLTP]|uniref:class I SAM-dependent methyltransferase n=1 Tax=Porphyrobacter sp. SLTP TaxID=2683266 RepID=UPI001411B516|nr:methyltransferase domain-containing protein [Porphyrobacter sp. SLTP]NBB24744.1 methyltransferase domain-containing protein [Porphyrobacter sp. SLTP]